MVKLNSYLSVHSLLWVIEDLISYGCYCTISSPDVLIFVRSISL